MVNDFQQAMGAGGIGRFLTSPVPWQHLYRRTLGRSQLSGGPAHWAVLSKVVDSFDPATFDPRTMSALTAPTGSTWADPFAWSREGQVCLFFEDWPAEAPHAHLSMMPLDATGSPTAAPRPILRSGSHLSYPYVFEHLGELWMLPENSASGRLELYRCEEYPAAWVHHRTLMEGVRYADPSVFEHEGRWWMFITLGQGVHGVNTDLFLFHTDDPVTGDWHCHPRNPIVRGFHQSRPAGKPFLHGGCWHRPAQNCFKRYGHGLRIHKITELDPHGYQERLVREILPWTDSMLGIHHLDIRGKQVLMDVHFKGLSHEDFERESRAATHA